MALRFGFHYLQNLNTSSVNIPRLPEKPHCEGLYLCLIISRKKLDQRKPQKRKKQVNMEQKQTNVLRIKCKRN